MKLSKQTRELLRELKDVLLFYAEDAQRNSEGQTGKEKMLRIGRSQGLIRAAEILEEELK